MSEKLIKLEEKLDEKLDKITDKLNSIDITLVKQEMNLQEHMKRTELAEISLGVLKDELKPVQAHVLIMNNIFKVIGVLTTFLGFIGAIIKTFF
jgi:hypothetical protein